MTLSYDEILEYEAAFRAVDVDNDGAIDVKELGKLYGNHGNHSNHSNHSNHGNHGVLSFPADVLK